MLVNLTLTIPSQLYLKDPQSSNLGRKILENSIILISKDGLENFTFKKLALKINSNESSIYRYFENKHKLMLYLTSWYWGWLEFKLDYTINNIISSREKLKRAIYVITESPKRDESFGFIDEEVLYKIVINEYSRTFQTKNVDQENEDGYFIIYKNLHKKLCELILSYQSSFSYPKMLANTILQGVLKQKFLNQHFSQFSDDEYMKKDLLIRDFFEMLTFKMLDNER